MGYDMDSTIIFNCSLICRCSSNTLSTWTTVQHKAIQKLMISRCKIAKSIHRGHGKGPLKQYYPRQCKPELFSIEAFLLTLLTHHCFRDRWI